MHGSGAVVLRRLPCEFILLVDRAKNGPSAGNKIIAEAVGGSRPSNKFTEANGF